MEGEVVRRERFTLETLLKKRVLHLALIVVLGLLAYSNTFSAPFQWDEDYYILQNPVVKDLSFFLEPSKAEGLPYYSSLKSRYVGYLTFALNYKLNDFEPRGYHIFNITIHILNALLVYLFVLLTFRTPFLERSGLHDTSEYVAFFSGLIFVAHPVQTEAVTYIFQRLASLTALFYLISLVSYIQSRLSSKRSAQLLFYGLSIASAILAMKTKENAFTLPIVIILYELLFFKGPLKKRALPLIPYVLTMAIVPLTLVGLDRPAGEIIGSIGPATGGGVDIPREAYLFTELRVLVTYMRLLFLPVRQNIDYGYPIFRSFFDLQVVLSSLFLLVMSGASLVLVNVSRRANAALRFVAFGVIWFFVTISVESSVIPIPMVIDEYRVYLPSVGIFMAFTAAAFLILKRLNVRKIFLAGVSALMLSAIALSGATYARNEVWSTRMGLWKDVVKKSPWNARAYNNLGNVYFSEGEALTAAEHYMTAISLKHDYAVAYSNLGTAYISLGMPERAMADFQVAVSLDPGLADARFNLGLLLLRSGNAEEALRQFEAVLRIKPHDEQTRELIQNISATLKSHQTVQ